MNLDLVEESSQLLNSLDREIAWLQDLERSHEEIRERLRQLGDVVSRMRERETSRTLERESQALDVDENPEATAGYIHERSRVENCVIRKTDRTYLIAKALGMEKTNAGASRYFDCNICLGRAEDPILTCCGHLFCWTCFYQLPCSYMNIKECPVCDGAVTDDQVTPIYGNGEGNNGNKPKSKDTGIVVPPRPSAKRVESERQNIINRAIPFTGYEAMQRMRRAIDDLERMSLPRGDDIGGMANTVINGELGIQPRRSMRFLPPVMPPPFSSSPSVADDYLEEPTGTLDSSHVGTSNVIINRRRSSRIAERLLSRSIGAAEPNIRALDTASPTISLVPFHAALLAEIPVSDASREIVRDHIEQTAETDPSAPTASSYRVRRETQTPDDGDGPQTRSRRRRSR